MNGLGTILISVLLVGAVACGDDTDVGAANTGGASGSGGGAGGADGTATGGTAGSGATGGDAGTGGSDTACENLLLCGQRLNIAHRGGGRLMPEETLAAYANAIAVGADLIEMDLHTTSDGVPVLLHDDTVDRTTDGEGAVHSFTYAELQEFDAGYHFNSADGYPERGRGHTIPSLEEVLLANSDQWILIEIKQNDPPMVDEVIAVLDATGMAHRVAISSFNGAVLQELREKRPDVLSGFSMAETAVFMGLTDAGMADYEAPARVLQPPHSAVNADMVRRADHLGIVLQPWTVNNADTMKKLLDLGVQGVMTDDPVMLEDVITKLDP